MVEENNSTVPLKEKNTNLVNVIKRRANICKTKRYIKTQQQLQKPKVVPGNNTYVEGRKTLTIGNTHIRRVRGTNYRTCSVIRNLLLNILVVLKGKIYIII